MEIKTSGTGWSAKLTPWITLMQGQITSQMGKLNPLPGRCKFYDQVLGFHVEDIEDGVIEKFIVVWTVDGETTSVPYPSQDDALERAMELLSKYGCDLDITLHLNRISPPPSGWFNKKRMRDWCVAGFPAVQI